MATITRSKSSVVNMPITAKVGAYFNFWKKFFVNLKKELFQNSRTS